MKVVLVELADKTGKVVVLEVLWEDDLCKLIGLLDHECVAGLAPGDYHVMFFLFEHPIYNKKWTNAFVNWMQFIY